MTLLKIDQSMIDRIAAIRARLADKSRWTQSNLAQTSTGQPVDPTDPSATCWCLMGAIHLECVTHSGVNLVLEALSARLGARKNSWLFYSLHHFNDCATHVEVLDFLDSSLDFFKSHIGEKLPIQP